MFGELMFGTRQRIHEKGTCTGDRPPRKTDVPAPTGALAIVRIRPSQHIRRVSNPHRRGEVLGTPPRLHEPREGWQKPGNRPVRTDIPYQAAGCAALPDA